MNLPEHPRLLFSQRRITDLKARINANERNKSLWLKKKIILDEVLKKPIELPACAEDEGQKASIYVPAIASAESAREAEQQWIDIDPLLGKIFTSDMNPQLAHNLFTHMARTLGVAYQVTGQAAYAAKSR